MENLSPRDLRATVLAAAAAAADSLSGLQTLSSTAHEGGVRVFRQKAEIARMRVSLDEEGTACVPEEQSIVLTPAAEALC